MGRNFEIVSVLYHARGKGTALVLLLLLLVLLVVGIPTHAPQAILRYPSFLGSDLGWGCFGRYGGYHA
eukprot:926610-Rhodomonas_salina.1